jgi:RNA polymerase sigma-70 factor (ECF subfamily)
MHAVPWHGGSDLRDALAVADLDMERPVDSDDALARATRANPDAFGQLYIRHRLTVYRYVRSRTSTEEDAIELTAVTFERALGAIGRYRPSGGGFVAWLLRIARNAAIDQGRRARPIVELDVDVEDGRPDHGPEAAALDRERRHAIARALASLPDQQRDAIALRFGSGLTARQIGEVLGKREAATQKLLSRALMTLRERIHVDI